MKTTTLLLLGLVAVAAVAAASATGLRRIPGACARSVLEHCSTAKTVPATRACLEALSDAELTLGCHNALNIHPADKAAHLRRLTTEPPPDFGSSCAIGTDCISDACWENGGLGGGLTCNDVCIPDNNRVAFQDCNSCCSKNCQPFSGTRSTCLPAGR